MSESDCLFCKIASREIPGDIVFENEDCLAFRDISPQAPTHVLVVPKAHVATLPDLAAQEGGEHALAKLMAAVDEVARQEGLWPGEGAWLQRNAMSTYVPPTTATLGFLPDISSVTSVFPKTC